MSLDKRYSPTPTETRLQRAWQEQGTYHFDPHSAAPVFSIDTPPPTVSGKLHLGHVYSYSHADFIARYRRMRGDNVYYPMGFDDNGLPTERLVERTLGITAQGVGRAAFIEKCLEISEEAEKDYEALWQRLGLSIDWRYTYRSIDEHARRASQRSFLDLFKKGLVYRQEAPTIWCPECQTAIAQAELNDLTRKSEFITLRFPFAETAPEASPDAGDGVQIATTRPELLPACVAVFVHPEDDRFRTLIGREVIVPLFGQRVPILADPSADPEKGTGAVMCCTFGDQTDVAWWQIHKLPLIQAISRAGKMTDAAGEFGGLNIYAARRGVIAALDAQGFLLARVPTEQSVRVHERCDTPVEYIVTQQWFVRVLDFRAEFLARGEAARWVPAHMGARYHAWVENLNWDWCISRQRYFGVPFPIWYCPSCGETILAEEAQLPIDPLSDHPPRPCTCGNANLIPESDVMDTWATSSMSPQIAGRWLQDPELYAKVYPFSLRPQAHEIIRTWAFDTIVKSHFHFDALPWKTVFISGWGLAGEGMGKISKSRGGGPMPPMEMIETYSADAVRYWAASTSPGKDAVISEEKIQIGAKLINKLWNVAVFSERFLADYRPPTTPPTLTPADRWILAALQRLIRRATELFDAYEYATAKSETENFFWVFTDNYLEMAKMRLYEVREGEPDSARYTLHRVYRTLLQLFAPFFPFATEEIYLNLFADPAADITALLSIHRSHWPEPDPALESDAAEELGALLIEIASAVRGYKSRNNLPLRTEVPQLELATEDAELGEALKLASADLMSITRAQEIVVRETLSSEFQVLWLEGKVRLAISGVAGQKP
ncbi:MAG: valine--tRNA ligase [Anaerolineales bacterium]|nr:valine--tRNA ligase [Anaerolineales bacterium]